MMVDCRTMDRNFCTPDGKKAALFCDLDGTLLKCQPYFDEAADNLVRYMQMLGFDPEEVRKTFEEFNHNFTEQQGFERDVYPAAMVACYRHLVKAKHRRFRAEQQTIDERILTCLGNGPYFRKPELFLNAAAVLGRAHHVFRLVAVTIGNREAQKYKVKDAGLTVFDDMIITSRDDKAELVKQFIEDCDISAKHSAFIGNSKRSDGACLAVTNFIYLPLEGGWAFDHSRPLPQSDFNMFEVRDWREAEEKGVNRLLRLRKEATVNAKPLTGGCCKK